MLKKILIITGLILTLTSNCFAREFFTDSGTSDGPIFEEKSKFEVLFFFNYNCSACLAFEPYVESWEQNLPKETKLYSVPFKAKKDWEWANKFHYIAKTIDSKKSRADIFSEPFINENLIVSKSDLDLANQNILNLTPQQSLSLIEAIDTDGSFLNNHIGEGISLAEKFKVNGTPTLVLNVSGNKWYKVEPNGELTYSQLIQVVNGLIAYHKHNF